MTELATPPTEQREGITRISHWIGGNAVQGASGRTGPVFNPALGQQSGEVDLATAEEVGAAVAAAKAAFPAWRATSLAKRAEILLPDSRAPARAPRGGRADPHGRARQGALGRDGRGHARPRGDRVRLRDPAPAQGRHDRAGLDRDRRLLDPAAARRRRRDHAVQLPRDGAHVDVGAGDRLREHVRAQAVGEGPVRVDLDGGAAQGGRSAGRRLQRRPRRQGRGRRAARAPGRGRDQLRRLDADRPLHLRVRHEARQAGAGARRRQEPHDRAAGRRHRHGGRRGRQRGLRLRRRALHGGLAGRGRRRRGDRLVEAIKLRLPKIKVGNGLDEGVEMGPLVTREHRDKVASYIEGGAEQGADGRRRRPRVGARGRRLLPRRHAPRRRDAGAWTPTRTRSSARCSGSRASRPTTRRSSSSTRTRTGTGRRSSPATGAPRGASSSRSRRAWSGSTCRSRCPSPTTRSAAGRRRSSATRHIYGPEGINFYTRGKVVTSRWPDPATSKVDLGFPQTR